MTDCALFLEEMKREMNQHKHIDELVSRYRVDMPIISAVWDLTKDAASFNNISEEILADGVSVYSCEMDSLWRGLFDPSIYDANQFGVATTPTTKLLRSLRLGRWPCHFRHSFL